MINGHCVKWICLAIISLTVILSGCTQFNAGYELGVQNQYYKDRILQKGSVDYINYMDLQMKAYPALRGYCSDHDYPDFVLPYYASHADFVWEKKNKTVEITTTGNIDEKDGIPEKIKLYRSTVAKTTRPEITSSESQSVKAEKKPEESKSCSGTGFAIAENAVVTALHVVKHAKKIELRLGNGVWISASVIKRSDSLDIAILQPDRKLSGYLPFVSGKKCQAGDKVFTFGYPVIEILGQEIKYSEGTISSMSGIGDDTSLIQTSVPIQPGNSGSPLLNENGEIVGMLTSTAALPIFLKMTGSLPQNVNWAVKAEYIAICSDMKMPPESIHYRSHGEMLEKTRAAICLVVADRPVSK